MVDHKIIGLETISGPMFAGKTNKFISELKKVEKYRAYRPDTDTRHDGDDRNKIISHSRQEIKANTIDSSLPLKLRAQIKKNLKKAKIKIVGFDEGQFFSFEIIDFSHELACELGIRVIVAGLDLDSNMKDFGPMPSLSTRAEKVTKLRGICEFCEAESLFTLWRKADAKKNQVVIGGKEEYAPVCKKHWLLFNKTKDNPKSVAHR